MIEVKLHCAVCRCNIDSDIRNRLAEKKIANLTKHCKYAANGCEEICKRGDIVAHENICSFKRIKCTEKCCPWAGLKKDLPNHKLECIFVKYPELFLEFNNQLNSQLQVLSEAINQRFLDLERRISLCNEIQNHIYPKINNQNKFQRMFLFDVRSDPSTWIAHFNNFYINWEISLQSYSDGLGIRLRPFGFVGNQNNLGIFNISLECVSNFYIT